MTTIVGQPVIVELPLDEDGVVLTGKASLLNALPNKGFRYCRVRTPAGTLSTVVPSGSWVEDGTTGVYRITITAAGIAGEYDAVVVYTEVGRLVQVHDWSETVLTPAQADPAGALSGATVTVTSPINAQTKNITVVQGADYLASEDTAIPWVSSDWPNLTGATVSFIIRNGVTAVLTITATVVTAGSGSQTVRAELTSLQTAALSRGIVYRYVLVTDGEDLLAKGRVIVVTGL